MFNSDTNLIDDLSSKYVGTRLKAVRKLRDSKDPGAEDILFQVLGDESIGIRHEAAWALIELNPNREAAPILAALNWDNEQLWLDDLVWRRTLRYNSEEVDNFSSVPVPVKIYLAELGQFERINPVKHFIDGLEDKSPSVRLLSALAIYRYGDSSAVEPLLRALDDDVEIVRISAIGGLGSLRADSAVDPLIYRLKIGNRRCRKAARGCVS